MTLIESNGGLADQMNPIVKACTPKNTKSTTCVTKAKYACCTFVHPESFLTRFGQGNKKRSNSWLDGDRFHWCEDVFGQEGRILPHHHAKQGTSKTNLAFPSLTMLWNEYAPHRPATHTHIMHENGFTPCRKPIPYVRSGTRHDARWHGTGDAWNYRTVYVHFW